jgi:transcriptional regulator with XRE-family HTH domain
MINRIRDIRKQKGLTLADVAARCVPTTAQTIGRLETGTRNPSLVWMNRIASALEVEPEVLVRSESDSQTRIVARLIETGADALTARATRSCPQLSGDAALVAMSVEVSAGEYRAGDQIWLRMSRRGLSAFGQPRRAGAPPRRPLRLRSVIDRDDHRVALLPPGVGQRQMVIDNPPWLAVAEMLVRRL